MAESKAKKGIWHETIRCVIRDWQLYLFLLVPVLYIIIFHYVPMAGIQLAFKKYSFSEGIWGSPWVGLDQFERFLSSYQFHRVLKNTLFLSAMNLILGFPIPIIFALVMNALRSDGFKKVCQTIVNLPHFISVVVLVSMINQVFNSRSGLYGTVMLRLTGMYPNDLFASPTSFQYFYLLSGVWQGFGWGAIIYIAALAGVSPELHEAAQIDGATRLQRIIHVDIPAIMPTITITLILRMGSVMSVGFEKAFLMQNGLNLSVSEIISTYVYKEGLTGAMDFSYSTAINLFNSIINMILIVSANWFSRKVSNTSLW